MKVYRYDTECGIYQGEEFVADLSEVEEGGFTAMAPPPWEKGFVPRFEEGKECWIMTPHTPVGEHLAQPRSICRVVKPAA